MPLPEQDEALTILDPYLERIRYSITQAWERWKAIPPGLRIDMSPRTRASIMHDNAISQAIRNIPEAHVSNFSELIIFLLADVIALRIKKLDSAMLSCNQNTEQVRKFREQQQLPGIQSIYNLEAGYVLDELAQEIRSVNIVCPNGPGIYWEFEIHENMSSTGVADMFAQKTVPSIGMQSAPSAEQPPKYRRKAQAEIIQIQKKDGQDPKP